MESLEKLIGVSILVFMAGNLLEMGLRLQPGAAMAALRDRRFVTLTLLWCFVLCPALAWGLARIIPLAEPYALGLIMLGTAPGAPFLPAAAVRAGGELADIAAFMLLACVGTVVFMPLAVPVLVPGLTANAWAIARPLVLFVLVPLAIGGAIRAVRAPAAALLQPFVRMVTLVDTLLLVVLLLLVYRSDFTSAIGSYAIGTQMLYYAVVTAAAYKLGVGLSHAQRSVLALGVCTRNIGAAIAPLFAIPDLDRRAITMCALAVPLTVIGALIGARLLGRPARRGEQPPSAATG